MADDPTDGPLALIDLAGRAALFGAAVALLIVLIAGLAAPPRSECVDGQRRWVQGWRVIQIDQDPACRLGP